MVFLNIISLLVGLNYGYSSITYWAKRNARETVIDIAGM